MILDGLGHRNTIICDGLAGVSETDKSYTLDLLILKRDFESSVDLNTLIQTTLTTDFTLDALLSSPFFEQIDIDSRILKTLEWPYNSDILVSKTFDTSADLDTLVLSDVMITCGLSAVIKRDQLFMWSNTCSIARDDIRKNLAFTMRVTDTPTVYRRKKFINAGFATPELRSAN